MAGNNERVDGNDYNTTLHRAVVQHWVKSEGVVRKGLVSPQRHQGFRVSINAQHSHTLGATYLSIVPHWHLVRLMQHGQNGTGIPINEANVPNRTDATLVAYTTQHGVAIGSIIKNKLFVKHRGQETAAFGGICTASGGTAGDADASITSASSGDEQQLLTIYHCTNHGTIYVTFSVSTSAACWRVHRQIRSEPYATHGCMSTPPTPNKTPLSAGIFLRINNLNDINIVRNIVIFSKNKLRIIK